MNIDAALSIANSGLASINAQLAVVSHNVANASTPGYVEEAVPVRSVDASGQGMGVFTGPATRSVDDSALLQSVLTQNAATANLQTTSTALSAVESADGTPGDGTDLNSLLGKLQDAFSTLLNDPSNQTQQSAVVSSAASLAQGLNSRSETITAQRQSAQDDIVTSVNTINADLASIGAISNQIIAAKSAGQSTADLQNQRDQQIASLSQLIDVQVLPQSNGDVLLTTGSGLELPIHSSTPPLSTLDASVGPESYYPSTLPGIALNGTDVTHAITGGQLGADIKLRDSTLPTEQAGLDEFAEGLATQFASQGLTLFTDGSGSVPTSSGPPVQSGYIGFAATIQVNPAVQATPSAVRDGTPSENASDAAGFNSVILNVLHNTFGTGASFNTTGLGPAGWLSLSFSSPTSLSGFAVDLSGALASASANASNQLQTEQGVQSTLQNQLTSKTGVSLDAEMSHMIALQNAYGANARVLGTVQSMFSDLLNAVAA